MRIELGSGQEAIQVSKSDLRKLTQQMANLLADLKIPLGKPVLVEITESSPITSDERVALILQLKKQPKQAALVEILRKPETKLFTLALHKRTAHVISDIPLKVGQSLLIKPNPNFLSPVKAVPELATQKPNNPQTPMPSSPETQSTRTTLTYDKVNSPNNSVKPLPDFPLKHSTEGIKSTTTLPLTPKIVMTSQTTPPPSKSIANQPQTIAAKDAWNAPSQTKVSVPPPPINKGDQNSLGFRLEQLPPNVQTSVKQLLRANLPLAEPMNSVLARMEHLVSVKFSSSMTQTKPILADKTVAKDLMTLVKALTNLVSIPLKVNDGLPPSTKSIAQAIGNSGILLESKLREQLGNRSADAELEKIKQKDVKAALLQVQTATTPLLNAVITPKSNATDSDALVKLLLGVLPNTENPQQNSKTQQEQAAELLRQVQHFTKRALAQIELRQIQSLRPQPHEQASNPNIVTLDIPLRLPDGLINLFMAFFEPETEKDKSKKKKNEAQSRRGWKLFLKLDLEDSGELAAELTLADKSINATLWADRDDLRQVAQNSLGKLRADLAAQGLEIDNLNLSEDVPPSAPGCAPGPLVDIET